ncbi:MAG: DNA-3-methyladenine glycosylase family protein [Candidatus Thorarchaeota archaeon]
MNLTLRVPAGYDLVSSVHSWIYPDVQPVPEVTWKQGVGRIFTFDNESARVLVGQLRPGATLKILAESVSLSREQIRNKIRWVLGLKVDVGDALAAMQDDPIISHIAPSVACIRPYVANSLFEGLIKSIIQQQVSYRAANVLTKRLVLELTCAHVLDGCKLYPFPTSSQLLNTGEEVLRALGLGYKARCILEIASLDASGEIDIEGLLGCPREEIMDTLTSIRGVGEWTVQMLMIAGFGDFTVFPYGDLGIQNLLGNLYQHGTRMAKNEVIEKAHSWGDAGPMVLYLLMCADVLGLVGTSGRLKTHKRLP